VTQFFEVELPDQVINAVGEIFDRVEEAEDAEILLDGQVAGGRGINRREVGARQRLRPARGQVQAFNLDGT
jgi:hypothetical protein